MIQIHSLQNAGWKLEKGLTLTLRLCSPLVLRFMGCDIGNEGEGKLAGKMVGMIIGRMERGVSEQ